VFAWWGRTVYRYRFIVIGVMVALCLGAGIFGISLGKHVTQSGFFDDSSQSVKASRMIGSSSMTRMFGVVVMLLSVDGEYHRPKARQVTSVTEGSLLG